MEQSILASSTEMVTVAMKRIELENKDDMLKHIRRPYPASAQHFRGVRNAEEAVLPRKWREAFGTNWLKLEITPIRYR